jgi:hypothetical protein
MRIALSKIAYDDAAARQEADFLRRVTEAANFLLAIFHKPKVARFQSADLSIVLRSIPAPARVIWRHYGANN